MGFFQKIADFFTGYKEIDSGFYEELEELLVMGDVGIATTETLIEDLKVSRRICLIEVMRIGHGIFFMEVICFIQMFVYLLPLPH